VWWWKSSLPERNSPRSAHRSTPLAGRRERERVAVSQVPVFSLIGHAIPDKAFPVHQEGFFVYSPFINKRVQQ
jgi:hypothetical protein